MLSIFKSEKQIIAEIHNEFDATEDRLLKEAESVLAELNIQTESSIEAQSQLSKKLGFFNAPVVQKMNELANKVYVTKQLADLILYYKSNYPFQKFLTEDELDRICKKYNLIYAPVGHYIKDVPVKNLKEIASAKELSREYSVEKYAVLVCTGGYTSRTPTNIINELKKGIPRGSYLWGERNNRIAREYFNIDYDVCLYDCLNWSTVEVERKGIFIAAPKSHFNLKGLTKTSGFSFNVVTIKNDPIVFRYCKGGIQALSKWGLEASDELLVNEICN